MAKIGLGLDSHITRAQANESSLGRLFDQCRPFLTAVACQRVGPRLEVRSDVSAVVQETLAKAHQAFWESQGISEPKSSTASERIHERNLFEAEQKH